MSDTRPPTLSVICPQCGARILAAGARGKLACGKCGQIIRIDGPKQGTK